VVVQILVAQAAVEAAAAQAQTTGTGGLLQHLAVHKVVVVLVELSYMRGHNG
jgi:hypothetical protein